MDIFNVLTLIGGLCLFLFGMSVMGDALKRRAGGKLKKILAELTRNKMTGFLTGLGVTSIIQSSSATTVMVVGFVNSGTDLVKLSSYRISDSDSAEVSKLLKAIGDFERIFVHSAS